MATPPPTQTPTPKGKPRTSWMQLGVVSAAEFVVWTGFGAIMPFLPIFLRDEAHSSLFMIGLISAMFYLGTLLFSSPFGWLSDMIGRKPVMIGGVVLFAVSMLLFTTTMNPWWFVVFRLLEGIGTAAVAPAAMAYVADVTTDSNRSKAYGILMSAQFGGLIVGPAIGAIALRFLGDGTAGFHAIFYFGAILAALTAVALVVFIREPAQLQERRRARRGAKAEKPPYSQILTPAILAFLLVGFTSHFAMGSFEVVWSLYLRDIGASTTYISATWIAFSVPMLFAFVGGIVADRYSRFILMFTGYTLSAAAWIIYGTTTSLVVFLVVNVHRGVRHRVLVPGQAGLPRPGEPEAVRRYGDGPRDDRHAARRPDRHADGAGHVRVDVRLRDGPRRGRQHHRPGDRRADTRPRVAARPGGAGARSRPRRDGAAAGGRRPAAVRDRVTAQWRTASRRSRRAGLTDRVGCYHPRTHWRSGGRDRAQTHRPRSAHPHRVPRAGGLRLVVRRGLDGALVWRRRRGRHHPARRWTMSDALTADEVGAITGKTMEEFPEASSAAQDGKPAGGYNATGVDGSKIYFGVDVHGGDAGYEDQLSYAEPDRRRT